MSISLSLSWHFCETTRTSATAINDIQHTNHSAPLIYSALLHLIVQHQGCIARRTQIVQSNDSMMVWCSACAQHIYTQNVPQISWQNIDCSLFFLLCSLHTQFWDISLCRPHARTYIHIRCHTQSPCEYVATLHPYLGIYECRIMDECRAEIRWNAEKINSIWPALLIFCCCCLYAQVGCVACCLTDANGICTQYHSPHVASVGSHPANFHFISAILYVCVCRVWYSQFVTKCPLREKREKSRDGRDSRRRRQIYMRMPTRRALEWWWAIVFLNWEFFFLVWKYRPTASIYNYPRQQTHFLSSSPSLSFSSVPYNAGKTNCQR